LADKGATFDTPMADIEVEAVWRQAVAALANSGFPPHAADASVPEANTQPENGNLNGGSEQ
jgi:hypothetical protein